MPGFKWALHAQRTLRDAKQKNDSWRVMQVQLSKACAHWRRNCLRRSFLLLQQFVRDRRQQRWLAARIQHIRLFRAFHYMVKQVRGAISQRHDRQRVRRAFNALFTLFEARCRKRRILRAWLHQHWILSLRSAFTWWQTVVSASRLEERALARHRKVGVVSSLSIVLSTSNSSNTSKLPMLQ